MNIYTFNFKGCEQNDALLTYAKQAFQRLNKYLDDESEVNITYINDNEVSKIVVSIPYNDIVSNNEVVSLDLFDATKLIIDKLIQGFLSNKELHRKIAKGL
jgi:ribosome-associated translation inhibitor RaiA